MAEQKIQQCSRIMAELGLTVAFAESATAGWLCSEFALAEESGKVLKGGITCYDADLKVSLLGVPRKLINQFTPESMEVTREMAYRLEKLIPSNIQVTITGLTTPGGSETKEKPVGTMFVFAQINGHEANLRKVFEGSCEEIIHQTISAVADLLINELQQIKNNNINLPLWQQKQAKKPQPRLPVPRKRRARLKNYLLTS